MKIALVVMSLTSGGAEILCRSLSTRFTQLGHKCLVVAISKAAAVGNSEEFEESFKRDLDRAGVEFVIMSGRPRANVFSGAHQLRRLVKDWNPDILHVHTPYGLLFQSIANLRVPTIYTHHNIRLNFPPILFRAFDRHVHTYVAISQPCAALLDRHVRRPIEFIPNGVPEDFGLGVPRARLPRHPKVLSVGTVTPQKDYPTLVRAVRQCVRHFATDGRTIRFFIAGGGELKPLRTLIEAEGVQDHIELLGTRTDVPQLMSEADLLVNSSIFEGLPITMIEASMSALPIVATDVGGSREVVDDGRTGFLVPSGRPDLIADKIIDALSDEQRYIEFSNASKSRSEQFTISSCASHHLRLYTNAVGSS